jgi:SAM-dependent methyltransferase
MPSPQALIDPTPFDDGAFYDLLLGNLDYGLDFYCKLARAAGGAVLDVACGTGRILLPCLREGIDIEGLDLFPGMLAQLRTKAAALGLKPTLHEGDMRSFHLARRFALIMVPFNAIVHCLSTDEQLAALTTCRDHLAPGGQLAFDTFFPDPAIVGAAEGRFLEGELAHPRTGLLVRCYDNRSFDCVAQVQHSLNEIEFLDAAGNITEVRRSRTATSWIYKKEMELLLRAAGFARWQICGDFDGRPLEKKTDNMIVQAWRAAAAA